MNFENIKQFDRDIFNFGYQYLLKLPEVTAKLIDKHIYYKTQDIPQDMSGLYRKLLVSAQNTQMSENVISKSMDKGIDSLKNVLENFVPQLIVEKYGFNWDTALKDIFRNVSISGKKRTGNQSLWPRFAKTVVDGASFLNKFKNFSEFRKWVNVFDSDDRARAGLPWILGSEIRGFSFALSCDLLKEIGYENFGKPDIHLKTIFFNLHIVHKKSDYHVFRAIDRIGKHNNKKPYCVDKLFWLIGSGKFHLESNLFTGRNGDEFIEEAKAKLNQYY